MTCTAETLVAAGDGSRFARARHCVASGVASDPFVSSHSALSADPPDTNTLEPTRTTAGLAPSPRSSRS